MATNNKQIALDVLEAVGGAENVTAVQHCITRLRFNLKDRGVPDDEKVKAIKGVMGVQRTGVQYQVIIGQNVTKVYDELLKLDVAGGGSVDEDLGDLKPEKLTLKSAGAAILDYLSKSIVVLIPGFMSAGFFRTVAVIAGPGMLGLWASDSAVYNLFYNWMYDAFLYFLPVILGWSCAKQLGCSQVLGMMLGGVLIAPEFLEIIEAASETGATTTAVYGLFPAQLNDYTSSILPMLLCMPVLWQLEKFFKRVVPDILSTVFVPFLTMLVMVPVALCVLAPIGSVLGSVLGTVLYSLSSAGGVVGILSVTLIAALWEFLVMTGMHAVISSLALVQFLTVGYDAGIFVAGGVAQFATWGMAFGAFLRLKNKEEKTAELGYFLSGFLGGVTEPALYGCGFKFNMRPFVGMVAGGAVGGFICALSGATMYVFGSGNILWLVGYVGGGTANLVWGVVGNVAGFVVAALVTYLFGFTSEQLAEDAASAALEA